ncbi:PEGA domain-containing protein [Pedobacter caeni]|uniref:PEGA domain-containing protein n=1 Tax=Pedobacter caeni TaxID=288992 RepID=A0A1M5HKL5_9SPHI|nr:PEGA domain-containing protein [Pedobacter caeni]SHG16448.1 PEGA domain-containing protein [Pedobacter caeni]
MKKILSVSALSLTLLFSGCATIFTGSKQTVQINSVPPGADIEVDGLSSGVTPAPVRLKKGFTGQTVTLKKAGFETKTFQPATTFNAVSVINLLFIIGWGIDAATGAMMKYDPKVYEMKLEPSKESSKEVPKETVKEAAKAN